MFKKPYTTSGAVFDSQVIEMDLEIDPFGQMENVISLNSEESYYQKNNDSLDNFNSLYDFFSVNSDFNTKFYIENKLFQNFNLLNNEFINEFWISSLLNSPEKINDYYNEMKFGEAYLQENLDRGHYDQIVYKSVIKPGPIINCGAIEKETYKPVQRFNLKANGTVRKIISDSNGDLYIIGNFNRILGFPRKNFAKIDKAGRMSPFSFNVTGGDILDIAIVDNYLIIVGSFNKVNGEVRKRFAIFNLSDNTLDGLSFDINNTVNCVAAASVSKIVLGGLFTEIDSLPRQRLAMVSILDGSLSTNVLDADDEVKCMFWDNTNSHFYIGGKFTSTDTFISHSYLMRTDINLAVDDTWKTGLNGQVISLNGMPDSFKHILVTGDFTQNFSFSTGKTCLLRKQDASIVGKKLHETISTGLFSYENYFYTFSTDSKQYSEDGIKKNINNLSVFYFDTLDEDLIYIHTLYSANSNGEYNDLWLKYNSNNVNFESMTFLSALFVNEEFIFINFYKNEFGNFNLVELSKNYDEFQNSFLGDDSRVKNLDNNNSFIIDEVNYTENKFDNFNGKIKLIFKDKSFEKSLFRNKFKNNYLNFKFNKNNDFNEDIKNLVASHNDILVSYSVFPQEEVNYSNVRNDFIFEDWKDHIRSKYEDNLPYILNYDENNRLSYEINWRYSQISTQSCLKSLWPLDTICDPKNSLTFYQAYIHGELKFFNEELTRNKRGFLYDIPISLSYNGFAASSSFNTFNTSSITNNAILSFWDVPYRTNSKPFFDIEQEFSIHSKRKYKNLSTIQEYRSSEFIEEFINNTEIPNKFSCTGSSGVSSDFKINSLIDKQIDNITFNLDCIKLFRPYDGLYPVQQGLRLASILSSSLTGVARNSIAMSNFYRPGIFWNSLTCGIPMHDVVPIDNNLVDSNFYASDYVSASANLEIIPFETIHNPYKWIHDKSNSENPKIVLLFQTSSYFSGVQQNVSFPTLPDSNEKYETISKSFFNSFNDFFLENEEEVKFTSSLEKDLPTFIKDEYYGMRITLKRTCNIKSNQLMGDNGPNLPNPYYNAPFHTPLYDLTGSIDAYKIYDLNSLKIIFKPTETKKYTFSEILSSSSETFNSLSEIVKTDKLQPFSNKMQNIQSFMNVFNFEDQGDSTRWCPSLKQEIPALNFDQNNGFEKFITTELTDRENITGVSDIFKGYLYSHGISDDKGLFLMIEDLQGEHEILGPTTIKNIKSLSQMLGFKEKVKRIGKLKAVKKISELLVLIPFDTKTNKTITINEKHSRYQPDIFDEYNFPSEYDYKYGKASPYLMYELEISSNLTTDDISNIWQNVMPSQSFKFEEDKVSITENNKDICRILMSKNISWKIFKIKKKAKYNKGGNVKYNYPYDFFSLIEMAKITVDINYKE
jgi:hypothetical protein